MRWKLLATAPDDLAEKGFQTNAPSSHRGVQEQGKEKGLTFVGIRIKVRGRWVNAEK